MGAGCVSWENVKMISLVRLVRLVRTVPLLISLSRV